MPLPSPDAAPLLELRGVSKRYGGVRALDDVTFAARAGAIHAVMGENGAGKSTLIKICAGVVQPDAGELRLGGQVVRHASPAEAARGGVVCVFQELSLVPDLTVADNICLDRPPRRLGLISGRRQVRVAEAALARIGVTDLDPRARVRDLPLSRRQLVEIAKALVKRPRLLILDEATSALAAADVERVFALVRRLRDEGVGVLYVSHRMAEIEALADEVSVFRNGRHVATFPAGAHTPAEVVRMMVGRDLGAQFPPRIPRPRPSPLLSARGLAWEGRLKGVDLDLGAGEIVGLGGLDGQGQKEVLLALFGVLVGLRGEVRLADRAVAPGSPAAAARLSLALIPEDRKTEGLMLPMSVAENLLIATLPAHAHAGLLDRGEMDRAVARSVERLRIKLGAPADPVWTLSGGNQQKVVIARWLLAAPRVILLNDPTRGIDVGTKQELYRLLRELADAGAAILLHSTDTEELVGLCDRVAVMYDGRVVRELEGAAIDSEAIIAASLRVEQVAHAAPAGAAA